MISGLWLWKDLEVRRRPACPDPTRRPWLRGGLKPPWGGVPPPKVFGVRRVATRKGVSKNEALSSDVSGRSLYGFVLGFVLGKLLDSLGKVG